MAFVMPDFSWETTSTLFFATLFISFAPQLQAPALHDISMDEIFGHSESMFDSGTSSNSYSDPDIIYKQKLVVLI